MPALLKKLTTLGPVLIVTAAVLWSLDGVLRRSLFVLPAVTIVFYEHAIGSLLLAPVLGRKVLATKFTPRVLQLTFVIALLSGLLGTLWFTTALLKTNFIPFSVVFLLQKLQPLFAITAAAVLLKEKITGKFLALAAVALAAAYFVTFPGGVVNFATGEGTAVAALFAVGAAFAWGTSTVFSKMLISEVKSDSIATALRFFATTPLALVAVLIMGQASSLGAVGISEVSRLVMISLSTGMVALWIYYKGLATTPARISTLLELTFPMLAVFIDAVLYKTLLAPSQYLAALVLLATMYTIGKQVNTKPVAKNVSS